MSVSTFSGGGFESKLETEGERILRLILDQAVITAHCTLHCHAHRKLHSTLSSLHIAQCSVISAHCTLHSTLSSLHIAHCTVINAKCTVISAHCSVMSVYCTPHFTARSYFANYTAQCHHCKLHTEVHPTVITAHRTVIAAQ